MFNCAVNLIVLRKDQKYSLNIQNVQRFHLFQNLPAPVKRRLKALKKLQFEATNIEAKFYEEIHQLEMKYHKLYEPLYEKRTKITTGK